MSSAPQALVLVPTRELAIQVAEAMQRYAAHMKGFHVLPVYGGQSYAPQLHSLRRGVHVVVGTPGRVMDHIKRGTLKLDTLKHLVLDEADEMLRMGFIDDVEWILEQMPTEAAGRAVLGHDAGRRFAGSRRTICAIPPKSRSRARPPLRAKIRQRYWMVSGMHKLDALTRILEAEPFDAMLVFARTKIATEELARKTRSARVRRRGAQRRHVAGAARTHDRALKSGKIDIVVATDVAARGLDVERISHVVNYDVPSRYRILHASHRPHRSRRAQRRGDPVRHAARAKHAARDRARDAPADRADGAAEHRGCERTARRAVQRKHHARAGRGRRRGVSRADRELRAGAQRTGGRNRRSAGSIAQGKTPLLLDAARTARPHSSGAHARTSGPPSHRDPNARRRNPSRAGNSATSRRREMDTYRIEVGREHGVQPGNIVGAIANEAGIDGRHIGRMVIRDDHSFVDLPAGMPKELLGELQKVRVAGQKLEISRALKTQTERLRHEPFGRQQGQAPRRH